MTNNYNIDLENIQKSYPTLIYEESSKTLKGQIRINKICNDEIIKENYDILIDFKNPKLPYVYELGKKVRRSYEHKYSDNRLCLATDIEQVLFLEEHKLISRWITKYIESYFVSYEFFKRYGIYPFGEYSHGKAGILEFYRDYFSLQDENNSSKIIKYILTKKYRGHDLCPCGSNEKIRNCHKNIILRCKNDDNIKVLSEYYRRDINEK